MVVGKMTVGKTALQIKKVAVGKMTVSKTVVQIKKVAVGKMVLVANRVFSNGLQWHQNSISFWTIQRAPVLRMELVHCWPSGSQGPF